LYRTFSQPVLLLIFLFYGLNSLGQKDSLTFLALGDSYTVGTSEIYQNSWPVQLKKKLQNKKILLKKPQIIAGAGWTTEKLLEQLELKKLSPSFNLVSLQIGVNNQYRNQKMSRFQNEFSLLLEKSVALANNDTSRVFVLSIPDWGITPFARLKDNVKISKEIKAYNAIIKKKSEERGVLYIDVTKSSREALYDNSLIAKDSLHPSRKMYKSWVRKIVKELNKNFKF